jgi:hypothetical protein
LGWAIPNKTSLQTLQSVIISKFTIFNKAIALLPFEIKMTGFAQKSFTRVLADSTMGTI